MKISSRRGRPFCGWSWHVHWQKMSIQLLHEISYDKNFQSTNNRYFPLLSKGSLPNVFSAMKTPPVLAEAGRELDGGTVVIVVDSWQQMGRFERMIQRLVLPCGSRQRGIARNFRKASSFSTMSRLLRCCTSRFG